MRLPVSVEEQNDSMRDFVIMSPEPNRKWYASVQAYLPALRTWLRAIAVVCLLTGLLFLMLGRGSVVAPPPRMNPAATDHLPVFLTPPGSSDTLFNVMAVVLIGVVLAVGVFFFWLHSLPERLVHKSTKMHLDLVAVLALLSLFTHIHAFWVAALLLAFVEFPDLTFLGRHLQRITNSLERIADGATRDNEPSRPFRTRSDARSE
jgi:hypothetical protein